MTDDNRAQWPADIITGVALGAAQRIDVMCSPSGAGRQATFRNATVEIANLADERLERRFILPVPAGEILKGPYLEEHVNVLEQRGWEVRYSTVSLSASCVIVDGSSAWTSRRNPETGRGESSFFQPGPTVAEFQRLFDFSWESSAEEVSRAREVLHEDLLSIPLEDEKKIVSVTEEQWQTVLRKLDEQPEDLHKLDPRKFEELVFELLLREGYDPELTPATGDGGKDIIVRSKSILGEHIFLVECKRYDPERPVGVAHLRALYGVVESDGANAGLLVTTSRFTSGAIEFEERNRPRIALKDYEALRGWIGRTARGS
jgi:HJR/Mrr/RecB family endonuclease